MISAAEAQENKSVKFVDRVQEPAVKTVYWTFAILVVYVIARYILAAALKPLWFDEVLTLAVASQPSARDIWRALANAVDGQGPLFYLLEKASLAVTSNKQIALRLFPVLGLACTLVCVFAYIKRRNSAYIAFIGAAVLLLASLSFTFATEARAYSMVVACIAIAVICYQRVPSVLWTALLGVGLAVAESLHYYAVFCMVPFGIAEIVYTVRARRVRWLVWLALGLGAAPLIAFWPLLSALKAHYSAHLWIHYSGPSVPMTYGSFFHAGGAFGVSVLAVCAVGVIAARLWPRELLGDPRAGENDPVEGALLLALLALPISTYIATKILHGGMLDRYVAPTMVGIAISLCCALSLARRGVVGLFALFVLLSFSVHEFGFWRGLHSLQFQNPAASLQTFVQRADHADLPVAISDGLVYLPTAYYASVAWEKRFVYLNDKNKSIQYVGTDNVDEGLVLLNGIMPLRVEDYGEFIARHPRFLLYAEDGGYGFDWLPGYLPEVASVEALVVERNRKIYLVTMRGPVGHE